MSNNEHFKLNLISLKYTKEHLKNLFAVMPDLIRHPVSACVYITFLDPRLRGDDDTRVFRDALKVLLSPFPKMKSARHEFQPVLDALQVILRYLSVKYPPQLIVGTVSQRQLMERKLPEHINIIPQKLQGPRVSVRRRWRHFLHAAVWPNDHMIEGRFPLLAWVISGEADFRIADYAVRCRVGDCVLFPINVPRQDGSRSHFVGDAAGRHAEILWTYTGTSRESGLTCWITHEKGAQSTRPKDGQCRVEHRFLTQLFNGFCAEAFRERHPDVIPQIQRTMFALLRGQIAQGNVLKDWGRPRYQGENGNEVITEALTYIEEYLDERLTVDKVAGQIFLSPSTFLRLLKQETGKTFSEYQTQRRMEIAEELLKTTDRPIFHIGRRVGLKDGQLRALFHQKHGCSPREYRKRVKMK